jgi:hypothetical protein
MDSYSVIRHSQDIGSILTWGAATFTPGSVMRELTHTEELEELLRPGSKIEGFSVVNRSETQSPYPRCTQKMKLLCFKSSQDRRNTGIRLWPLGRS